MAYLQHKLIPVPNILPPNCATMHVGGPLPVIEITYLNYAFVATEPG